MLKQKISYTPKTAFCGSYVSRRPSSTDAHFDYETKVK